MLRTLFSKLLLIFLCFGGVMTIAFIIVMRTSHESSHLEIDQTVSRDIAREYVSAHFVGDADAHHEALPSAAHRLARLAPSLDVYLLDASGAIVASSIPSNELIRKSVSLEPVEAFLTGTTPLPILAEDPLDDRAGVIFSAARIDIPSWPARYLYLVLNRREAASDVQQIQSNYAIGQHTGFIVIAVLFAVLATLFFIRNLTRNLARLEGAMNEFRRSDFSQLPGADAVAAAEHDEIGRLTRLFVELAARIHGQIGELKNQREQRREFMANVSHDLRTPLTSLQAHLDTLRLKESQLTADERSAYVEGAARQCDRLRHLMEQLLEAERLDTHQITPHAEPFQLGELVQDVVQKFGVTARERGVQLGARRSDDVPLVVADIGLIERVLDNLLENALRFAPADGRVSVTVAAHQQRVRVEVEDNGPGMSRDVQARVFERFYRADPSRSTSTGHAGLGLSIVRSIVELHGGSVGVDSAPGRGARLWFELPFAPQVPVTA
ncbi:MAG: sensor histidine kinase [Steroidobacteraceae bacterium]